MPPGVADLLSHLVAIDSVNPSLVPGAAGEGRIAAHVAGWARDAGLETEVLEATPGRPSVLVRSRGRGGGATLLLCGHLDTVTTAGMADPLRPRIEGDRLYGRGAYDMKAGVAAALIACHRARRLGLAGDVVVAAVADEEHASLGVQEALGAVRADAAIVKAGPVLTAIGTLDAELGARTHPLLGRGSVHASVISGGEELSSYPARCVVGLERRTLPGDTGHTVEAELERLLEACRAADPALEARSRTLLVRDPFEVAADAPVVGHVRAAAERVLGAAPPVTGASYWADAAFIAAAGIPTVMFGPAGEGAHAAEEWVSLSSAETVVEVLVAVAERVCA